MVNTMLDRRVGPGVTHYDPFNRGKMNNMFEQLFDTILSDGVFNASNNKTFPKYNIEKVDDSNYAIEMALAGFDRSDIDITLSEGILTIRGSKRDEDKTYLVKNVSNREFEISFNVTNNVDVTDARMENGMLRVLIQKNDNRDVSKIEVK